jgi:hypothetical protein
VRHHRRLEGAEARPVRHHRRLEGAEARPAHRRHQGGHHRLEDRLEELPRLRSKKWTRTLSYRRRK